MTIDYYRDPTAPFGATAVVLSAQPSGALTEHVVVIAKEVYDSLVRSPLAFDELQQAFEARERLLHILSDAKPDETVEQAIQRCRDKYRSECAHEEGLYEKILTSIRGILGLTGFEAEPIAAVVADMMQEREELLKERYHLTSERDTARRELHDLIDERDSLQMKIEETEKELKVLQRTCAVAFLESDALRSELRAIDTDATRGPGHV